MRASYLHLTVLAGLWLGAGCGEDSIAAPGDSPDSLAVADAAADAVAPGADAAADGQGDAADAAGACPGGAGCACSAAGQCPGGACVPSAKGKVCAAPCVEGKCKAGTVCKSLPGLETKLCVPRWPHLCDPCTASAACQSVADPSGTCAAVVAGGKSAGYFCAPACATATDCPSGYNCAEVETIDANKAKHCVPSDGTCACSDAAKAAGLQTTCTVGAQGPGGQSLGPCKGKRTCAKAGLTACDAPAPTAEVCDGLDNDCSGGKDEGTCDDGSACTLDACDGAAKQCSHVDTTAKCQDGNACTDDGCDPATGCSHAANTLPCDDGSLCTSGDTCAAGQCASQPVVCDDGNACTDDACDKAKGCVHTNLKLVPCDDGNACTKSDLCGLGKCVGEPVQCNDKNPCTKDACDLADGCTATALDDGAGCGGGKTCLGGVCQ